MANKKRSDIWYYFTKIDKENAVCHICKHSISFKTTISNLKGHLRRKHIKMYRELISGHINLDDEKEKIETVSDENNSDMNYDDSPLKLCLFKALTRQRSYVWHYFTKADSERAVCNACKQAISFRASITNLKGHLRRKHARVYAEFLARIKNAKEETKNEEISMMDESESNIDDTKNQSHTSLLISYDSHLSPSINHQSPSDSNVEETFTLNQEIDRDLLDVFIKDFQPFDIVENEGFSKLMRWIPGYEIPTQKTISSIMIPNLYGKLLSSTKKTVSKEAETVCVTLDCWTSSKEEKYIEVTAHYITKEYDFKSVLLKCSNLMEKCTSTELAAEIQNILLEWRLQDKVNFMVSDGTDNVTKAIENVLALNHYGCYAHKLNLIVKQSLQQIYPVIEKVRKIIKYFKFNSVACAELLKYQISTYGENFRPKELIIDVATQWNSTFHMLCKFIELEDAIKNVLVLMDEDSLADEEWHICKQLCEVLSPFDEMVNSMSDHHKYMTGSSVIVVTRCLMGICEKFERSPYLDAVTAVIALLKNGLQEKFKDIEYDSTFTLCTFLDPRYKGHVFQDPSALGNVKKHVQNLVVKSIKNSAKYSSQSQNRQMECVSSKLSPVSPSLSAWCIFNDIIVDKQPQNIPLSKALKEIDCYLEDEVMPRLSETGENNCPLDWWKKHQYIYPNLAKLFRSKCNIVATSVPCERLFSKSALLIDDRKAQLMSDTAEMIIFLNANGDNGRFP